MKLVLVTTCCVLILGAFLVLYRALKGPTVFDRILAVNAIGTKAVLLVATLGFFGDPAFFLDTSMVYALINFAATIAILRYVQYRRLG